MKKAIIIFTLIALNVLFLTQVFALNRNSVIVDSVSPGEEGTIRINLENDGKDDIKRLSFNLNFENSKIIPAGSSEAFIDELKEDDDETIVFRFKIANNLPTGTYSLPYKISYEDDEKRIQNGIIGIVVSAEPELEIIADSQSPIIGKQTRLNVRIVNRGLADARFVSLFIEGNDLTILSEKSEYIGTVESDDFESSSFDVIYNEKFNKVDLKLTYKDFNNVEREIVESASLRAYTQDEAIQKGILTKNNVSIYVIVIIVVLVIFFVFRAIRKRRKPKN